MGDDGVYDEVFDVYGFLDFYFVIEIFGLFFELFYIGSVYVILGSEVCQWVDMEIYFYIDNMVQVLQDNFDINIVILSIGGNDILVGCFEGGWYKDMDLDVLGFE